MTNNTFMQKKIYRFLLFFLATLFLSAFLAVLKGLSYNGVISFPSFWGTLHKFVHIYILTLLGIGVYVLSIKFPADKEKLKTSIPVYAFFAFVFGALESCMYYLFSYSMYISNLDDYAPELGGIFSTYFRYSLLVYWVLLGFCLAYNYYRENQKRKEEAAELALKTSQLETKLIEAQLQSLKRQLQPHFLFNTLHAINGLIVDNPVEAKKTMALLSDLLRISFEKTDQQENRFKDELDVIGKYLEIQRTRFKDRLNVEMDIHPDTLDALVPTMILQPLTENAIAHGISPYKNAGLLKIAARNDNGELILEVHDSGKGCEVEHEVQNSNGIGISNTIERLKHLYPGQHSFEMKDSPIGGLFVQVKIPFQKGEDNN